MCKRLAFLSVVALSLVLGCQKPAETSTASTTSSSSTAAGAAQTSSSQTAQTTAAPGGAPATEIKEGLQTPESVLYDPDQDVYFISNINGDPLKVDDNGFISRVDANTLQVQLKWIDGASPSVTLNAPKGMAIIGDDLYVADITTVRRFDRKSGAPKGEIPLAGTTFLNDVAADGTTLYVSDTGMKAGPDGSPVPSGTDAVWKITGNAGQKIASGDDLHGPNGVAVVNGEVWTVAYKSNELYSIQNGAKGKVNTMPAGGLDGLVPMSDGSMLVTSWDGKAVYRGKPGGPFTPVVQNAVSPADIGYDSKRHRLLIPHLMENRVTIHEVQ